MHISEATVTLTQWHDVLIISHIRSNRFYLYTFKNNRGWPRALSKCIQNLKRKTAERGKKKKKKIDIKLEQIRSKNIMYYGTCCGRAPLPFCAFNPVCFVCWLVCSTFWFPSWILRLCSAFHHRRLDWCSSQAPALITAAGLKGLWFRESSLPRVSFLFVASSSCCLLPGALVQIKCTFVGFVLHMTRNTFA